MREKVAERFRREFEREEEKRLALHQPWQYYYLYVMYEVSEMVGNEDILSEETIEKIEENGMTLWQIAERISENENVMNYEDMRKAVEDTVMAESM